MCRVFLGCLVASATVRAARADPATDGGRQPDALLPEVDVPVLEPSALGPPADRSDSRDDTGQLTRIEAAAHAGETRSTADLVAEAPGTQLHRLGDPGQQATVALRGSTSDQVLVLLDGIPLTSAAGASVDLSTIPEPMIDHVDVLRGDVAARYGAGALGGVVNLITRRAQASEGTAEVSAGSFGTLAASAADGLTLGRASSSFGLSFSRSDGDFPYQYNATPDEPGGTRSVVRENNQSLVLSWLGSVSARVGSGSGEALVYGSVVDRGLAGSEFAPTPRDHLRQERGLVGLSWSTPALVGPFDLSLIGYTRADALDVREAAFGDTQWLDLAAGLEAVSTATFGAQRLSFSVEGGDEALSAGSEGSPARGTLGLAAVDRVSLFSERVRVVPAVRLDVAGQFVGASPKLGLSVVSPWAWAPIELRANAGLGFRAPTFGELYLQQGIAQPNPDLQPETNQSVDWAAVLRLGATWLSVGGFLSHYDNLILYELYPPFAAKPFNEGKSFVQGVEIEGSTRPLQGLELTASYTFLDAFDDDPHSYTYGRELPYRPQHHGHGRASWSHGRLALALEADGSSSQSLNRAATLLIPGHALLDGSVAFRIWDAPGVWLAAGGRNLLNSQAVDSFGYPLPSMSFFLSLRVSEASPGVAL